MRQRYVPPSDPVDLELQARLRGHVEILAGVIGPRWVGRPTTIEATTGYIEHQFSKMGNRVAREEYSVNGTAVANLIVEYKGSRRPNEIIVVGAHYDTVSSTPGADDNASAVAMLLELARSLKNCRCQTTIRFVAFACEEPPHFYTDSMGSQIHARGCRQRSEQLAGMICLEMVGYFSTEPQSQRVPPSIPRALHWLFPSRGDFLVAVGNLRSIPLLIRFWRGYCRGARVRVFPIALPERVEEIRLSDNSSFWDQGYPALMLTDTSFLRNPHYHERTDTPETLDFGRLTAATRGVARAIRFLARG